MGLDAVSQEQVHTLLRRQRDVYGTTILLATQDEVEARSLCDQIVLLDGGRVTGVARPLACRSGFVPEDFAFETAGRKLVLERALTL